RPRLRASVGRRHAPEVLAPAVRDPGGRGLLRAVGASGAQVAAAPACRSSRGLRDELPEVRTGGPGRRRSLADARAAHRPADVDRRDGRSDGRVRQRSRVPVVRSHRRARSWDAAAVHADDPGSRRTGHRRVPGRGTGQDRFLERVQGARPLVGGAAALLSPRRADALVRLLVLLAVYGAVARHLPELPSGVDVVFHATVVFPAFAAAIWLALPLARMRML